MTATHHPLDNIARTNALARFRGMLKVMGRLAWQQPYFSNSIDRAVVGGRVDAATAPAGLFFPAEPHETVCAEMERGEERLRPRRVAAKATMSLQETCRRMAAVTASRVKVSVNLRTEGVVASRLHHSEVRTR